MSPYQEPLWGQCRCGAVLTYDHITRRCPLRPQQSKDVLQAASLEKLVREIMAHRLDTTHVAELGYN